MSYMISTQPMGHSCPGLSLSYSRVTQITLDFERVDDQGNTDIMTIRGFTLWTWWHSNQLKSPVGCMIHEFGGVLNDDSQTSPNPQFHNLEDLYSLPQDSQFNLKISELERLHDSEISALATSLTSLGDHIEESEQLKSGYGIISGGSSVLAINGSDWPMRHIREYFFGSNAQKKDPPKNEEPRHIDLGGSSSYDHALLEVHHRAHELKTKPQIVEVTRDITTGNTKVHVFCKNKLNSGSIIFKLAIPAGLDQKADDILPNTVIRLDSGDTSGQTVIDSPSSLKEDFQSWWNRQNP